MIRPLKIAQVAPIVWRVPPKKYGGTERVVDALTEELVKRGHEVTLFATGDSITSAKLFYTYPISLREAQVPDNRFREWKSFHSEAAYRRQHEFDIIHDHNALDAGPTKTPVVLTFHGLISKNERDVSYPNFYPVAISNSQKEEAPNAKVAKTIYNGLRMQDYPFSQTNDGYLLYVGRFSPHKGAHLAIDVAEALNLKLLIVAKMDPQDEEYFNKFIKPRLTNKNIEWIGEVSEEERNKLMSKALCLLHTATWEEPFGLNMIEAMACGAPVVAFNRGSVPEVVIDGETGFIVENMEEMVEAVKKVNVLNRQSCREHSLRNFSAEKMANEYEKLYYRILQKESQISSQREISFI